MAEFATPGASLALIDNFEVAWTGVFGAPRSGSSERVTPRTLFQAGSVSKVAFALAVMRLAQDGVLDLDADINDTLTSWRVPPNDGWQPRITLRQLLSHTAGTTVHGFPGYPLEGPWPTVEEILQGVPPANTEAVRVGRLPGVRFEYSGGGVTIAQQAVVDLLGRSFPQLMHDIVFKPVRMTCSTFEQHPPMDVASGHPWNGVAIDGGRHVFPEMAAAGLLSTAGDLALLGVDFLRAYHGQHSALGLTRETAGAMLRPPLAGHQSGEDYVGIGWFCAGEGDNFRCGHRGWNHGFVSEMTLFPALGKGAVVMLNSNQGAPFREEILRSFGREYDWPSEQDQRTDHVLPRVDYGGVYRHPCGVTLRFVQSTDGLTMHHAQQPAFLLTSRIDNEFFATALDLKVSFHTDAHKGVTGASLIQAGSTMDFVKDDT